MAFAFRTLKNDRDKGLVGWIIAADFTARLIRTSQQVQRPITLPIQNDGLKHSIGFRDDARLAHGEGFSLYASSIIIAV